MSVGFQINLVTKLAHGLLTNPGGKGFLRSMLCLGGKERDEACTSSLDMSLKSGSEVCWWDVLQPAQVMVGWGPEKKLFGAGGGG